MDPSMDDWGYLAPAAPPWQTRAKDKRKKGPFLRGLGLADFCFCNQYCNHIIIYNIYVRPLGRFWDSPNVTILPLTVTLSKVEMS